MILITCGNVQHHPSWLFPPQQHRYGRHRLFLLSTHFQPTSSSLHKWQNLTGIWCLLLLQHQRGTHGFYSVWRVMIHDSSRYLSSMVDQFSRGISNGKIVQGLDYSDEDVESSCKFVLFCPCKILEDGTMIKYGEFEDLCTYSLYFVFIVSQISTPHRRPSRSHRIHRIHNHRSIQCFYQRWSWPRRLQRHQWRVIFCVSLRQQPNHNIHFIPHPQTSLTRGKTTHPLCSHLWRKSRHHGGGRRDWLWSCGQDIWAVRLLGSHLQRQWGRIWKSK